jgi:hypothetical protein
MVSTLGEFAAVNRVILQSEAWVIPSVVAESARLPHSTGAAP